MAGLEQFLESAFHFKYRISLGKCGRAQCALRAFLSSYDKCPLWHSAFFIVFRRCSSLYSLPTLNCLTPPII